MRERLNDDFSQPRALFRLFDAARKRGLFSNVAAALKAIG